MFPDGPRPKWSKMIPDDHCWSQMIPDDPRLSRLIPNDPRMIPDEMLSDDPRTRWSQMMPCDPRWYKMISDEMISEDPKRNDPKWFQTYMVSDDPDAIWGLTLESFLFFSTWIQLGHQGRPMDPRGDLQEHLRSTFEEMKGQCWQSVCNENKANRNNTF